MKGSERNVVSMAVTPERSFCDAVRDYLLSFSDCGVTPAVLDAYVSCDRVQSLPDVYGQLVGSAQNRGMMSSVISGSMTGGLTALSPVLFGFDPHAVAAKYGDDSEALLMDIVRVVKPKGKVRRGRQSAWPQFCRSIVAGARFLGQFSDADEFYRWADSYESDPLTRYELPAVVAKQVQGYGYALACDFLKELGYANYAKPDTHIRTILMELGLITRDATDRQAVEAMAAFSKEAGLTSYHVDKLMWLLGSGNFYKHSGIKRVPTERDEFVASHRGLLGLSA